MPGSQYIPQHCSYNLFIIDLISSIFAGDMGMDPHMDPSQQDPHQAQNQVGQGSIMFRFFQLTNTPLCRHNLGMVSQASSRAMGPRGPVTTPCVPPDMDHQCRLSEYQPISCPWVQRSRAMPFDCPWSHSRQPRLCNFQQYSILSRNLINCPNHKMWWWKLQWMMSLASLNILH